MSAPDRLLPTHRRRHGAVAPLLKPPASGVAARRFPGRRGERGSRQTRPRNAVSMSRIYFLPGAPPRTEELAQRRRATLPTGTGRRQRNAAAAVALASVRTVRAIAIGTIAGARARRRRLRHRYWRALALWRDLALRRAMLDPVRSALAFAGATGIGAAKIAQTSACCAT